MRSLLHELVLLMPSAWTGHSLIDKYLFDRFYHACVVHEEYRSMSAVLPYASTIFQPLLVFIFIVFRVRSGYLNVPKVISDRTSLV